MMKKEIKGKEPLTKGAGKQTTKKGFSKDTINLGKTKTATTPQSLSPYEIFERCIKRARNLVEFHPGNGHPEEEKHFDAYRAAVVLSISALDAFVRTLVIDKIKGRLMQQKKLPKKLAEYMKDVMSHDALFDCARKDAFFATVSHHITVDFQTKSFQGKKKITYYMELAGYNDIFSIVSKKASKRDDILESEIEDYTARRHTIAHGGDYDINQTPYVEKEITKPYAENCITSVSEFAKHLNEICNKK